MKWVHLVGPAKSGIWDWEVNCYTSTVYGYMGLGWGMGLQLLWEEYWTVSSLSIQSLDFYKFNGAPRSLIEGLVLGWGMGLGLPLKLKFSKLCLVGQNWYGIRDKESCLFDVCCYRRQHVFKKKYSIFQWILEHFKKLCTGYLFL